MIVAGWARMCAVSFLICGLLCGCMPSGDSQLDEQKEPNFIAGKNLVSQMDYQGAAESYEKSLTVNPHSASAHYELGWLYDEKLNAPADAIYHYSRYLKYSTPGLKPDGTGPVLSDRAQLVQQRINSCKLEVAKTVSAIGPLSSAAQREIDRLTGENKILATKVDALQQQLTLTQANAAAAAAAARLQQRAPVNNTPDTPRDTPRPAPRTDAGRSSSSGSSPIPHADGRVTPLPRPSDISSSRSSGGSYVVRSGDTPASIARKHAIPVSSLLAANPQLRPTHLVVGQSLVIPSH